jgi:hypothetical protein
VTEPSIEQLRDAIANFVSEARSEPGTTDDTAEQPPPQNTEDL